MNSRPEPHPATDSQPRSPAVGAGEHTGVPGRPFYQRPQGVGIVAIILLVIGGAVAYWLHVRGYESTDDAFIDAHVSRVAPRVAGRVRQVPVDDNQWVEAGALLVEIDPADYQVKRDQAVAAKAEAESRLHEASARQTVATTSLQQAQAETAAAEANATNAATDLARIQRLRAQGVASQQEFDNANTAAKDTAARLAVAREQVATNEAQVVLAAKQIQTATAAVQSATATLEQANLQLSYTQVRAAEAGRVTHKSVAVGDYVQIGQDLMAMVPRNLWVTANFKETQLTYMRTGQPVEITVDAYPGKTFAGHVDSIQAGSGARFSLLPPENATGNYVKVVQRVPVKIVFDDPPGGGSPYLLGPGMSVVPWVKVR
jgi:membrane fusion protein (multidrug efflux system)